MRKRGKVLLLASRSPRRMCILRMLRIPFDVAAPHGLSEESPENERPEMLVRRLATEKALVVFKRHPSRMVLAADTVVACKGKVLGKPRNRAEAFEMLRVLQDKDHSVWTGTALIKCDVRNIQTHVEETEVSFRKITTFELRRYLNAKDPYDKAGGYDIHGMAAKWIRKWKGDYFNVMGLPVQWVLHHWKRGSRINY